MTPTTTYDHGTQHPGHPADPGALPPLLARAHSTTPPAGPLPPGPRMNPWDRSGSSPVVVPARLGALLTGLWHPGPPHLRDDGTATTTPRRPVPSAGGTYPVHTHLVVGDQGLDDLGPGRYVYDHLTGQLLRRDDPALGSGSGDGWDVPLGRRRDFTIVLTAQPARSLGRYRHRAWPLWVADAAYARHAVDFLLSDSLEATLGPGPHLRRLLGVPSATSSGAWLDRGLVPEVPLVSLTLPSRWAVDPVRDRALRARRSPALRDFTRLARPDEQAARLAVSSGQSWVQGADRVRSWSIPLGLGAHDLLVALWQAHGAAARLCYDATLSDRWRSRPVSGIAAEGGRWTVHGLAMLSLDRLDRTEQTP